MASCLHQSVRHDRIHWLRVIRWKRVFIVVPFTIYLDIKLSPTNSTVSKAEGLNFKIKRYVFFFFNVALQLQTKPGACLYDYQYLHKWKYSPNNSLWLLTHWKELLGNWILVLWHFRMSLKLCHSQKGFVLYLTFEIMWTDSLSWFKSIITFNAKAQLCKCLLDTHHPVKYGCLLKWHWGLYSFGVFVSLDIGPARSVCCLSRIEIELSALSCRLATVIEVAVPVHVWHGSYEIQCTVNRWGAAWHAEVSITWSSTAAEPMSLCCTAMF